jgi:uncharacterized membrane protein
MTAVIADEKETMRAEAFSDAVFAIAITLLALELKVPGAESIKESGCFVNALMHQWPVYFAFMVSFVNVLIIWVCHHNIFSLIKKTDGIFLYINGFLLLTVSVFPFTSALLGEYINTAHSGVAAAIFAATIFFNCLSFNLLWNYASFNNRLLVNRIHPAIVKEIRNNGFVGLPFYVLAVICAFFNAYLSIAICTGMAVFFAVKGTVQHLAPSGQSGQ